MRLVLVLLLTISTSACSSAAAPESPTPPGPWQKPPKLDKPTGRILRVRTEAQLRDAVSKLRSNTTILIEPGTYRLNNTLYINGVKNVALRGASDERGKVILKGKGMRNRQAGDGSHGIIVGNATDVLIANMSIGDYWFHPIALNGHEGCKRVRMFNLRLFDAGEQFLKSNPNPRGGGADDCIVEYCVFEFTDTSRHFYTQGMSVHGVANWTVRNNLFRNIRGPKNDPNVGGCIDFWNGSRNTTVEGNVIVNCRMGIRFGIENKIKTKGFHDHQGGIVRNNLIWRQPGAVTNPDGGIMIWDSPGTKVLNNTVILNDTFGPGVIEFRWSDDVVAANNLTDGNVWKREEVEAKETNNVVIKDRSIFADAGKGDLRLQSIAATSLRRVPVLDDCPFDIIHRKRGEETSLGAYELATAKSK